jgi:uncharacterized membrane protein
MEWFKQEFARSNIISGFLAIAIWGAIIYLAVVQVAVPDILYVGGTTVIAFFFGSKVGQREGMERAAALVERVVKGG